MRQVLIIALALPLIAGCGVSSTDSSRTQPSNSPQNPGPSLAQQTRCLNHIDPNATDYQQHVQNCTQTGQDQGGNSGSGPSLAQQTRCLNHIDPNATDYQ